METEGCLQVQMRGRSESFLPSDSWFMLVLYFSPVPERWKLLMRRKGRQRSDLFLTCGLRRCCVKELVNFAGTLCHQELIASCRAIRSEGRNQTIMILKTTMTGTKSLNIRCRDKGFQDSPLVPGMRVASPEHTTWKMKSMWPGHCQLGSRHVMDS